MQDPDLRADPDDRREARSVGNGPAGSKSGQIIGLMAGLLVLAAGAYWYWSPILALHSARAAAEARDADTFNQFVDYPKVRESLKGQFAARMTEGLTSGNDQKSATTGAALGAMLGIMLIDKMVDSLVRPEIVMSAMNEARVQERAGAPEKPATSSTSSKKPQSKEAPLKVRWAVERKGLNRVIALASDATKPVTAETQVGFVFERSGFADWKLTEIRLPQSP